MRRKRKQWSENGWMEQKGDWRETVFINPPGKGK